jgi:hypothetical protein
MSDFNVSGINLSKLMSLFLNLESGVNHDFSINLDASGTEGNNSCKFSDNNQEIGYINYGLSNLFEPVNPKPSVDISIINNFSEVPHLGTYLMACFMLYNASNLPRFSNISFNGYTDRRRGDLDAILKDATISDTFGGRKSQMLHLNFGFKPQMSKDVITKLFNTLSDFDVSCDFTSKSNNDDSYFSKLICTQLNSWGTNNSNEVNNVLSIAYHDFINSLVYVNKYINATRQNSVNKFNERVSHVYAERFKNSFINSYKGIYNKAFEGFKKLRTDLKHDLTNMYVEFTNLINTKLVNLIEPFDRKIHSTYLSNIIESSGMKEFSYLVEQFNPVIAGIPLPKPEQLIKNFDLVVNYLKKI